MNNIGVFDSGIGGFSILEKLLEVLPDENYIYYKDSKNCPYGSKSDEELLKITTDIVSYFDKKNVKLVVIACNTATTKCIRKLRELFPNIIFVGTEPAIKVACDRGDKNILVLATPATISSDSVDKLVKNNQKDDQNIFLQACDGLARAIEDKDDKLINGILSDILNNYKDKNIDSVVLGCTHYSFVKDEISNFLPGAELIDGSLGVARQVKRKLEESNKLSSNGGFVQIKNS
ncbi:MAG: glutamate racemase [Bacilli bacterium]|nr:glutamate racemase [Bacilli bacterium]